MESSSYNSHHLGGQGEEDEEVQVASEGEVVQEASMATISTPQVQLTVDDIVDASSEIDLTPLDDEPPDDLLLTPYDPTADLSPAAQAADFTCRVQTVADTVRPTPAVAASSDEPPPIDSAYPEAPGEPVDVDTHLAATAKWSRKKAAGHHKNPWLFGHWTVKNSPPNDAPPPDADAMGEPSANGADGHDDLEVF
jgi:hypothetical protein